MKKIYARQVPPDIQESPITYDDFYNDDIAVFGNRDLTERVPDNVRKVLDEVAAMPELFRSKQPYLDIVAALLTSRTGHKWTWSEIHGCCQGEWQNCIYDTDVVRDIREYESWYFNLGTEWICEEYDDETFVPDNPDDINGVAIYCTDYGEDETRAYIAQEFSANPEDVVMYTFDGYTRNAKYKLA